VLWSSSRAENEQRVGRFQRHAAGHIAQSGDGRAAPRLLTVGVANAVTLYTIWDAELREADTPWY